MGWRAVRYGVAMSLDGFIAGPNGEYDWILKDDEVDAALEGIWGRFDTLLMGRRTYEIAKAMFTKENLGHRTVVIASRTLPEQGRPEIRVVRELDREAVRALRAEGGAEGGAGRGKDIWLMGGGDLFRHLLAMGEVDGMDVSVIPVLLSQGVAVLPAMERRTELRLTAHTVYRSGIVHLSYDVMR